MKNTHAASHIRFVFFLMGLALVLAWTQNAHADTVSQLSIAPSGQVMVRGAVVTAIDGYTVTAVTTWGSASLEWTVETTGSTSFVPRLSSSDALKSMKVGDTIEFNGVLQGTSSFSVSASSLRDTSLVNENAAMSGQVLSVIPGSGIFLVDTGSGTTTVSVSSGTILTRNGDSASLSDVEVGDTVRAWGSLNTRTQVLSATKAAFTLQTANTVSAAGSSGGIFSSILAWLSGSRGALSVRDR